MRDYSTYNKISNKERKVLSAKKNFERMYDEGYGFEIIINGDFTNKKNVLVIKHTVQMSQAQEERKLFIKNEDINFDFFQGDVISGYDENVTTNNFRYMVMTTPSSDGVYSSFCKIRRVNSNLKFITEDGVIHNEPCILTDQTLYTDGVYQDSMAKYSDDKRGMAIRYTEATSKLKLNQRLMFNNSTVYYVAKIDDYTLQYNYGSRNIRKGIMLCVLARADGIELGRDNYEIGVADYYNYFPKDTPETPTVGSIIGIETLRIGRKNTYSVMSNLNATITWSLEGSDFVTIKKLSPTQIEIICDNNPKIVGDKLKLICTVDGIKNEKEILVVC